MPYALLPQRQLLQVSGEDASSFLQGLVSNDVSHLSEGGLLYGALLSPQGKYLHDFFIALWQGSYWIDGDASGMEDLRKRLMLYRLRSKVDVVPSSWAVAAVWQQDKVMAGDALLLAADPRLAVMGWRAIGPAEALEQWGASHGWKDAGADAYDAWRLSHGVPDGAKDMVFDKSLLLEFGFEQLHGVDFKKGCYVGQEVTARSKFRANLKKSLYQVQGEKAPLPAAGTEVFAGESLIGVMCSSAGSTGLALLRMQELEESLNSGFPLRAGEVTLTVRPPQWLAASDAA